MFKTTFNESTTPQLLQKMTAPHTQTPNDMNDALNERHIQEIDWNFLTDTIHDERCIVFIGPEVFSAGADTRLEEQLFHHLKETAASYIQDYYPADGLMLFNRGKKTAAWMKVKEFYNQPVSDKTHEILQLLADLPFHFIISLTPDTRLAHVFAEKRGVKPDFDFYFKNQPATLVEHDPSVENPLLYNMFGCIDSLGSMVLTHTDLYDYIESIFSDKSMPIKYKNHLQQAHNFIFIGIDFKKWYMHILLRVLRIHTEQEELMRFAANQSADEGLKTFCYNQFQIEFVPHNSIRDFLAELRDKYYDRFTEGVTVSTIERVRQLALHGKLEDAFDAFDVFLTKIGAPAKNITHDVSILSGSYFKMLRDEMIGKLDSRDAATQLASILDGFLTYVDQAKDFE